MVLLSRLIADWRSGFQRAELPFLIVQLPGYFQPSWPRMREAQEHVAQKVPGAHLVCAIDLGDAQDIHPLRKRAVGERLALRALARVHGMDGIIDTAPAVIGHRVDGAEVRLEFAVASGLTVAGGGAGGSSDPLVRGFAIAGADRVFVPAQARIAGDAVIVSATAVPSPVAVRYAWAPFPDANLVGPTGLPVVPFRTDAW